MRSSSQGPRQRKRIWTELIVSLKGDPWKLTDKAVASLRQKAYPDLFKGRHGVGVVEMDAG